MSAAEFVAAVVAGKYASKKAAEMYVAVCPKEEYGTDDIIAVYRQNEGNETIKPRGHKIGVNGGYTTKTFAQPGESYVDRN